MNSLLVAVIALLTILALPALIVLFIGIFITGIGAVAYILVKIGLVSLCIGAIALAVWIVEMIF